MTLVERFVEFNDWPASRKTALLMGVVLSVHLVAAAAIHLSIGVVDTIDIRLVERVHLSGVLAAALCLVASLLAMWAGRDARWTAYAVVTLYGAYVVAMIQVFGTWSTPILAIWPMVVILVAVWYDVKIGIVAFGYGVVLAGGTRALESSGVLPYAPALIERSIEGMQSAWWLAANIFLVGAYFTFSFALVALAVAARRLQDQRLRATHGQLDRANQLIRRYVPSQLAEKIVRGEHVGDAKPERAKLTVVFSDIEGFTDASDRLDPEELENVLNEYLTEMMAIAEADGATVNQIIGDGIMIFFGAPQATSDKDHAKRAVHMALEMQQRMTGLADAWRDRGIERPFRIRIGINTGYASVGDYGSLGRKTYSAVGVQTNVAARIQAHCQPGKILISHTTWALVHDEFPCVERGEAQVKGVHYPIKIYEVAESAQAAASEKIIKWPRSAS